VVCARARYNEERHSLPWFRRKKQQVEQTTPQGAVMEAAAPAEPEQAHEHEQATPVADDGSEALKRKRRRGSRGGRGRKKPAGTGAAPDGEPAAEAATEKPAAREKQERSQRAERTADRRRQGSQASQRRRVPPRRAPLPAAKRELLISVDVGEQRVAVIEDDRVAEVYLERPERRSIAGNIYLGVVDNVLPGMEAAFVEIGLEKNGFLYVDEIVVPELEGKRHGKKIQDLISRGEQLLVQAVKDPMKTKGARLTTEISLPGRFLVYVPNGEGLGVSRRLEDAERARLKEVIKNLDVKEGGVIVRTAAEGASAEDVERDLVFLQRLWKTIQARAKGATAPELVYQEAELPLRIVRDLFAGDFVSAQVDNERAHKRIVSYLKKTSPHMIERVHRYKEKEPLFEASGVEKEIQSTLDRRVDLPSGGYLVFDYAEAFTVVDVNTGRFVGSRSKTSNQRLEDTITKNNLEAVKEVVRQLRLRDIGGIIVIDFIDMANPKNRASVEDALRTELERDRTKTYVVEISPLGLVEMTRQNVTDGPREILTRKCPTCAGDGIVVSDQTIAMQIERRLRTVAAPGNRVQGYKVALHPRILALLAGQGGARLAAIEEVARRRFFLVPAEGHVHADHFEVVGEGKLVDLQPASPLVEGATVELKLVEVDLYDATAGAGRIDGVDVIVADAAKLVGKKASVLIGRVLEGQAFGLLAGAPAGAVAVEEPITFESEAEKPTRAPARRKAVADAASVASAAPDETDDDETDDDEAEEWEDEPAAEADDEVEGEPEADVDGTVPPKKRTRRGSRGGRRRRKPAGARSAAAVAGADDESEDAGAATEPGVTEPGADEVAAAAPAGDEPAPTADGEQPAAPGPATTPRRRRTAKIHMPDDGRAVNGAPPAELIHEAIADVVPDEADTTVDGDADGEDTAATGETAVPLDGAAPAPKKRTRRGSRGGRNRKKKPVGAEAAAGNGSVDAADEGAELGEPPVRPEAPAAVTPDESPAEGPDEAEPEPETIEAAAEAAPAAEGYVPMSEWLDDFDRR
jgi:ribonuclease G